MTSLSLARMANGEPEIFVSIQGEGVSAGVSSTFVRLSVCNLRCGWCDTAYTWDWSRFDRAQESVVVGVLAVAERVLALTPRNVVLTGGEPLIQRRQLARLVEELRAAGCRIEVETNGTIAPGPLAALVDQWNVSPKLGHSGNEGLARVRPAVLAGFGAMANAYCKVVIRDEDDVEEAAALAAGAGFADERVVLMPEGRVRAEIEARSPWLAEACAARGFRFSSRLHVLLWGDVRGR